MMMYITSFLKDSEKIGIYKKLREYEKTKIIFYR